MIAGHLYRCAAAELVAARIHARQVVRAYNASDPAADHERRALLAGLFAQLGEGAVLEPPFHVDRRRCRDRRRRDGRREQRRGAGSVVIRDVPAGVVAASSPCRLLRHL